MKQKLKNTISSPPQSCLSSQRTTQTSFFPVQAKNLKPLTAHSQEIPLKQQMSSIEEIAHDSPLIQMRKFRTLIEPKPRKKIPNPLYFSMSDEKEFASKFSQKPKKIFKKKLSFILDKKQESSNDSSFLNLGKAKELPNFQLLTPKTHTIDPNNFYRDIKKCSTLTDIKLEKNIIKTTKKEKSPHKPLKIYEAQSNFLSKIVKINKPKFETKIDFLKQGDLQKNYQNFLFAQGVLLHIKSQCKGYSSETDLNMPKFIELSKDTYTVILQIFPLVKQAISNVKNRPEFDKVFSEIEVKCQLTRNMALTLKTLLLHAKLIYMLHDVYKSIILYKNCKKLATNFSIFHCMISCYKGLGRCFQTLKQYSLALTYFSKMLQCSWKINDKDHEILAYDLIGMQYYYMGDLEKSKYYHQRMVNGEFEPESSNVRRLAVLNFLNKKNKNPLKDLNKYNENHKFNENPLSQFTENLLDSSDEGFELPNPSNRRNASEPDLKKVLSQRVQTTGKIQRKYHLLGKDLMTIVEKTRKERLIGSMRSTDEFRRLISKNISQGRINKNVINTMNNQEKILLSHLSPNRDLQSYQAYKPNGLRNINFYNINDYLYENDEFPIVVKMREKLKGYAEKLLLTINKLKAIFSQA